MRTRIWHSDWKPRWLIRCVSAALLSFMDKQERHFLFPSRFANGWKGLGVRETIHDVADRLYIFRPIFGSAEFVARYGRGKVGEER